MHFSRAKSHANDLSVRQEDTVNAPKRVMKASPPPAPQVKS